MRAILSRAAQIPLREVTRGKYFRLVAQIEADGVDVSQRLLKSGLAVPYDGGTKTHKWCE